MTEHVLERLAATNPEAEIWWDSSPLIYQSWKEEVLSKDPDPATSGWSHQLARLFEERTDVRYGLTTMCVGMGMGGTVLWENVSWEGAK